MTKRLTLVRNSAELNVSLKEISFGNPIKVTKELRLKTIGLTYLVYRYLAIADRVELRFLFCKNPCCECRTRYKGIDKITMIKLVTNLHV